MKVGGLNWQIVEVDDPMVKEWKAKLGECVLLRLRHFMNRDEKAFLIAIEGAVGDLATGDTAEEAWRDLGKMIERERLFWDYSEQRYNLCKASVG